MRNLITFVWRNYFFFLFLLLEVLSIYLVVQNNFFQRASFINSSNEMSASVMRTSAEVEEYFFLKAENDRLAQENAELRSRSMISFSMVVDDEYKVNDTAFRQKYVYTSAKVVNNSNNLRNNFLTLDKGSKHGIKNNMAVITSTGVVGQVKDVSENYCTVMSLLNSKTTISSKIKKDGSYGPLTWDGEDFRYATLHDIPTHVKLVRGDSVVTSSYSLTFPENIMVGRVDTFERKAGEYFYTVKVRLATEFNRISHVYVVTNKQKEEQEELEKRSETE